MIYKEIMLLLLLAFVRSAQCKDGCEQRLVNCTGMMQPVLDEVRYMFPVSQTEIEGMCQVWSGIMECVRGYVGTCSSEEQRTRFHDAVGGSVDAVHAICSSDRYRRDYLEYATCYRKVSMENCGHHFRKMVDSAYNPHSQESQICCAYREYEKCVSEPIQRQCGAQALRILDDSMSSLKLRCEKVFQTHGSPDKLCHETPDHEALDFQKQRPSYRHLEHSPGPQPSTPSYLVHSRPAPYTTQAWTPRTVIYPLPPTRQRIARNEACLCGGHVTNFLLALLVLLTIGF